ncbi:MAG TPA: HEAT repeat domain-containing protein [Candidatus Polarisedimenticolaceae bacterium]|nr:HEAT repeat domain-containing protein [Candidatus Polarisedimenticolaceae bacterium]
MTRALRVVAAATAAALAFGSLAAQTTPPPTPEQLAARERVRPRVDAIWKELKTPADPSRERPRLFWETTDALIALGPDVVPFLASEVDLMDPQTFAFSAYALGRIGGADAEAALRKAVRSADARGGRFGQACKRFALFGLALIGTPDVFDLAQNGEEAQDVEMIVDLPLMVHMAILIGPAAIPVLEKQLDTYASDPTMAVKLQHTLRAIGRAGDASLLPKVLPLLSHASPGVRAQAADALSRIAPPATCEKIMPLLADTTQRQNYVVADAIGRWKPEPCYKAMLARLEVETNAEVRAQLYYAITGIAGEASLDVLRAYLQTSDFLDRTLVVDAIGRVGSKKGLNMLRVMLGDMSGNTSERALEAIAEIGGEGAIDTLLAATSDRRRLIAFSACRLLTELGVKKAAPRIASNLLDLVREPVGDLSLRPAILDFSNALVALGYTDPLDDVKKAAEVQSDPEIRESLASCARRLELLKRNGEDVAAWTAASTGPQEETRRLAERRLAQIGSPAAVAALEARTARPDLPASERAQILHEIGEARAAGAAAIVERHLAEPAFDAAEMHDARADAAWAARRIGGDRMAAALRASAVRREGRDFATVIYLAVLEKAAALDTLRTLHARRLRYPEPRFGREEKQLDGILWDLAAGRAPTLYDVTPEALLDL